LEGHESAVMHVIELPDGHLLSASNDGSAKVWDIDSKKAINTIQPGDFEAGEFALGRCAILSCGIHLLAGLNRMIYIYDKSWSQKAKIRMRSDIEIITACGDYQFLVGQKDGNLVMFDLMENLFNAEDEWI
jgi:WD40 repeat protein